MPLAERDKKIADEYSTGKCLSAPKLALKWSLSVTAVRRILAEQGAKKPELVLSSSEDKIIDENHRKLGNKLYFHRTIIKTQDTDQASKELNWSVRKLRSLEQGHTLITLIDLLAMADYMGVTKSQIMDLL